MNEHIVIELLASSSLPTSVGELAHQKLADFLEKNVPGYMNSIDIILIPCKVISVQKSTQVSQQNIQIRLIADAHIPISRIRVLIDIIKKEYNDWNTIPVIRSNSVF